MKKFRQELAECTEQQREEIYHLWGLDGLSDKGPQKRQDILLKRITDPIAGRFVWEHLTPDERQVLYRMLGPSARSGTPRDGILKKSQLPAKTFETILSSLKRHLLLWEQTVKVYTQPYYYSKSKNAATVENVAQLYPVQEGADTLYTPGRQNLSTKSDRSQMSLEKILTANYPGYEFDTLTGRYGLNSGIYYPRTEMRLLLIDEMKQPNSISKMLFD